MRLEFLSRLGFRVYVLDDPEKIPALVESIRLGYGLKRGQDG